MALPSVRNDWKGGVEWSEVGMLRPPLPGLLPVCSLNPGCGTHNLFTHISYNL